MVSSLYIHIPFCHSKCHYCSFSSYPGQEFLHSCYIRALKIELQQLAEHVQAAPLQTVFLGGGTPTVLPGGELVEILSLCTTLFSLAKDAEISIEANPGTVDESTLQQLKRGGFNRLSLGVQSFDAAELSVLGRCHSPKVAIQAYEMARKVGFANISVDLMYGLPGQTMQSWNQTLQTALVLEPDHLSMYQLTIEEGTPFSRLVANETLELPDEELILAMDELNISACADVGMDMYEISNFAKKGFRCRHNVNYWMNNPYMAAGAGAVSCVDGLRQRRVENPAEYCQKIEAGHDIIIEREKLDHDASFRETVIMGLRMTEGVARGLLRDRYGLELQHYYGSVLENLQMQQLVQLTPTHLRLTPKGRVFSNIAMSELV